MTLQTPAFETWMEAPKAGELRLVPIGGLGEFGMNALVIHAQERLFLVDCGQLFPGDEQPGVDSIVPDFAYVEPFGDKVEAVLLTHGHEDHIGALAYFLERWPVPVYGTPYTLALAERKIREMDEGNLHLLHPVTDYERVELGGGIVAEWIPVTHSVPDACALAVHTPQGTVVVSGDYKFDPEPVDGRKTGLARLKEIGDEGVAVLLADSTNVIRAGRAPSESECRAGLRQAFRETPGKLFVATFSSNIHRIQTLLELAFEEKRKVCIMGRSLDRNIQAALELRRLVLPDDLFIEPREVPLFKPSQVLVICTGSQGEEMSALSRILRTEVKGVRVLPKDRVLLSSRAIPGNEVGISRLLDDAARCGADTFNDSLGTIHVTGHAHREEAAELIRTLRPRILAPAHGSFRNLMSHGRLATELGYPDDRIRLLDGGQCLQLFADGHSRLAGSVPVGKCFVDQGVAGMVDARVVHDRLILQEDGIVVATLLVDPESGELAGDPKVVSRGFVKLSDDEAYGDLLKGALRKAFEDAPAEIRGNRELLVEYLRQTLRRIIRKTTQNRPLVVPIILDARPD